MKRWLKSSLWIIGLLLCQPVRAEGDFPLIRIEVENAKGDYYLDLLVDDDIIYEPSEDYYQDENATMIQVLKDYEEDGYHCLNVKGGSGIVIGNIKGIQEGNILVHTFEYEGIPEQFKIIIVDQNLNIKVSDTITKTSYQQTFYLDYETMKVKDDMSIVDISMPFLILCASSLIIEGVCLCIFKLAKKKNLYPFIASNALSNIILVIGIYFIGRAFGIFSTMIMWMPLLEVFVLVIEWLMAKRYYEYTSLRQLSRYIIVANLIQYIASAIWMIQWPTIFF